MLSYGRMDGGVRNFFIMSEFVSSVFSIRSPVVDKEKVRLVNGFSWL